MSYLIVTAGDALLLKFVSPIKSCSLPVAVTLDK